MLSLSAEDDMMPMESSYDFSTFVVVDSIPKQRHYHNPNVYPPDDDDPDTASGRLFRDQPRDSLWCDANGHALDKLPLRRDFLDLILDIPLGKPTSNS